MVELTHRTTKKTNFLVATRLGEDALLIQVPETKLAGEVDGVIKIDGRTSPKFPPFVLPVMTPLDTLFHNSIDNTHQSGHTRISKVRNCTSLLSATLAYLVTLSPHKITREVNADVALQRLMAMVHKKKNQMLPLFIRDLCSGPKADGETILHFSLRNCFYGLTYSLIDRDHTPVNIVSLLASLDQESHDCLTPRFLAREFHPDILAALESTYEAEIGSRMVGMSPPPGSPHGGRKSHSIERKLSEFVTKVKKRTSRQHSSGMKRRSALLEVPMGFGSMPDMSAIQRADFGTSIPYSPTSPMLGEFSRSQSHQPDRPDEDDVVVSYDEHSNFPVVLVEKRKTRKKSLSVDTGLNKLTMLNRPLPEIPNDDSDNEDKEEKAIFGEDELYSSPRLSRLAPLDKQGKFDARRSFVDDPEAVKEPIYDIPKRRTLVPRWMSGSFIVKQSTRRRDSEDLDSIPINGGYDDEPHDTPRDYEVPTSQSSPSP